MCTVTGSVAAEAERAIRQAAEEDRQYTKHLADSNFGHQARAVESLGFELFEPNGAPVPYRSRFRADPVTPVCAIF